jgi:SAM-dependent methyltransferase
MDRWKYFAITHADHVICNPLSEAKVDELVGLFDLPAGGRVLDIGSGKAEILARICERYDVRGVGVDLSPQFVAEARTRVAARGLTARVDLREEDGASYRDEPGSFDLAMCMGASWVYGGYSGTLRALAAFVREGGLVVVGEPFWKRQPPVEYLAASGFAEAAFGTHESNVANGVEVGLTPLYAMVSNDDDWDRYQGLQWRAAELYAARNPGDADVPDLLARQRASRDLYLRWERDLLGWAVYVFRK